MSVPPQGFEPRQNLFDNGFDRHLLRRPLKHESFPGAFDGVGLDQIDDKFLDPDQWPINSVAGLRQYRMFVQIMVTRIRAGESNSNEVQGLLDVLEVRENWNNVHEIENLLPEVNFGA